MLNIQRIRNYLSMILIELPAYIMKLVRSDSDWMYITNRNEKYIPAIEGAGVCMLGDFTSTLRVANQFPVLSNRLFKKACLRYPFTLSGDFELCSSPDLSFIIGHRGNDKVNHLKAVIRSIAGQTNQSIECIVIEQSANPDLENQLPAWVRYYHQQVSESDLYNRASAFNFGAGKAKAETLILHDNDLLIPECYVDMNLNWLSKGYDLVNLKRYIFGLNKADTDRLHSGSSIDHSFHPQYIMQNAKGGGSLTITKSAYQRIGGFDNRFAGWGGEDNELWQRAQILNIYPYANLPLIHLWHMPQEDKRGGRHGGGLHTENLTDQLSAISIYERIKQLTAASSC